LRNHRGRRSYHEVVVGVVIKEIVVNKLIASNSCADSWDGGLFNDDWEVIVGVVVIEVLVRNSGSGMGNWSSYFKISSEMLEDGVVVEGVVVEVVLIGHK